MTHAKTTARRLALLMAAGGFFGCAARASEVSDYRQPPLKVADRSPVAAAAGKPMSCGKCATQGMCGETYHDKLKQQKREKGVAN